MSYDLILSVAFEELNRLLQRVLGILVSAIKHISYGRRVHFRLPSSHVLVEFLPLDVALVQLQNIVKRPSL